jgi:hypothetical protein
LREKEGTKSRLVKGEKELKIKENETKDLEEKAISSSQDIPSNFDGGYNSLSAHPFFSIMLVKCWY